MKKNIHLLFILVVAIMLTTVVSAKAQNAVRLDAKIPFEFSLGDKAYAAGNYTLHITRLADNVALLVLADHEGNVLQRLVSRSDVGSERGTVLSFEGLDGSRGISKISSGNVVYLLPQGGSRGATYTRNREGSKQKVKVRTT